MAPDPSGVSRGLIQTGLWSCWEGGDQWGWDSQLCHLFTSVQSCKERADKLCPPLFADAGEGDGGDGVPSVGSLSLHQVENSRLGTCLTCTLHFYIYSSSLFLHDTIWYQLSLFLESTLKACGKTCYPEAEHSVPDEIHVN